MTTATLNISDSRLLKIKKEVKRYDKLNMVEYNAETQIYEIYCDECDNFETFYNDCESARIEAEHSGWQFKHNTTTCPRCQWGF